MYYQVQFILTRPFCKNKLYRTVQYRRVIMRSNEPAVVTPVAAEADAQADHHSCSHGLVGDIAKAAVVFGVAYGVLLGILLHQYT